MSKRLQVLIEDPEYRQIQRAARAQKMTVAEWVRQVVRAAWRRQPEGDLGKKLEAVRGAARHSFPSGDIDQMLLEIEQGYLGKRRP